MQQLQYYLLEVFTREPGGGNPLAVFVDAASIAPPLMPRIARELGLSETVFVLPTTGAALARLRIFTPDMELPFAGHPTIGTACLLASLGASGHSMTLEEGVGDVDVRVRTGDGQAPPWAQLSAAARPEIRPSPLEPARLAALLSLAESDIQTGSPLAPPPAGASCGVPFLFIPVRERGSLARCRLDVAEWDAHVAGSWAPHVFAYSTNGASSEGGELHGRMFAPAMGIVEDPATGAAATALAGLLAHHAGREGTHRWTLSQGVEMGRPSTLELEADVADGEVVACRVAGHSVIVGVREFLA
jgi:trans-2,3-dihydro-3-hydroxyanthranilate isomerase